MVHPFDDLYPFAPLYYLVFLCSFGINCCRSDLGLCELRLCCVNAPIMIDRRPPTSYPFVQLTTSTNLMAGTLDGYVTSSKSPPVCVATSQSITDRESIFIGSIYKAASIAQAQEAIRYHTEVVHGRNKASHEIAAWRCMVLKPGRTGLQGAESWAFPEFQN